MVKAIKTWNAQTLHSMVKQRDQGRYSTGVNNLAFRITRSGVASWVWQGRVGGKPKTITIGRFPEMGLADARRVAEEMVRARDDGDTEKVYDNRRGSKVRGRLGKPPTTQTSDDGGVTVAGAWAWYWAEISEKNKQTTLQDKKYFYRKRIEGVFGHRQLDGVTFDDLDGVFDGIRGEGKLTAANNGIAYIKAFFAWCVKGGRRKTGLKVNPALNLEKTKAVQRERYLSEDEIASLWRSLDNENDVWADGYRLCLITGQRRTEIFGLHTREIDIDKAVIQLDGNRTKNGRPHVVPLGPMSLAILKRRVGDVGEGYIFGSDGEGDTVSGFSRAHRRILDRMVVASDDRWRLHDLRRTVSTHMNGLLDGDERSMIDPPVIEALLNHVSGVRSNVAGTYNRHAYLAEKRKAVNLWEQRIREIIG